MSLVIKINIILIFTVLFCFIVLSCNKQSSVNQNTSTDDKTKIKDSGQENDQIVSETEVYELYSYTRRALTACEWLEEKEPELLKAIKDDPEKADFTFDFTQKECIQVQNNKVVMKNTKNCVDNYQVFLNVMLNVYGIKDADRESLIHSKCIEPFFN
ncbi:hypothetical protein MRY82_06620 [bacterium]|nr:hypothetical protein [bacterium]